MIVPDATPLSPANSSNQVVVTLSPAVKLFLDEQARLEGKTPAQILIAALLRTYNPHALDAPAENAK